MSSKQVAVSDTGPVAHLSEIAAISALSVFKEVIIPPEVHNEIRQLGHQAKTLKLVALSASSNDLTKILAAKYGLDLGEAEGIALAVQERIGLFLTDDLAARDTAKDYDLEPHGTLGILLRAFREGKLSRADAVMKVNLLYEKSTLYITKDLVIWIIKQIEEYQG